MKDESPETPANIPFKQSPKPGEMQEAGKFRTMADVLAKRLEGIKTGIVMKNEPQEYVAPRRRINSDTIWGIIIGLAVIGGAAWFAIHYFQTQAREHHAAEIQQQQTDARIATLVLKYNAVTNWEASLPDRGGAQPFSIDVSSALIRDDVPEWARQPVLIKCNVNDIFEKDGKIIASLSSVDTTNSLSLELQCSLVQAKVLDSTNQLSSFAVVFKCQEAQRLSSSDGEGFSVKGELLDVVQMP